jgi:hypothetical protein
MGSFFLCLAVAWTGSARCSGNSFMGVVTGQTGMQRKELTGPAGFSEAYAL